MSRIRAGTTQLAHDWVGHALDALHHRWWFLLDAVGIARLDVGGLDAGEDGVVLLELVLHKLQCETVPCSLEQLAAARRAFRRFGKGRHPAGLNLGDCFPYALARVTGEPLLFKGEDFTQTDIARVKLPAPTSLESSCLPAQKESDKFFEGDVEGKS